MKIIVAPDSFKGSCTSMEASLAIGKGILKVLPDADIVRIPMADGGEGTVEALLSSCGGRTIETVVTGPLGEKVTCTFGILNNGIAVIEMSAASGLTLVPEGKRNPLITTTFGTGELIKAALDNGCKKIIIGIGGSATNDGGAGMAQALGISLKDSGGNELGFGGGELGKLADIDISNLDPRINGTEIIVACDVTNPLYGEKGASEVYGPQKGATYEMVAVLDNNLKHFSEIIKNKLGKDIANIPGAGAAGGLGAGLIAFCNAALKSGINTILDACDFDRHIKDCDLIITGEGRIDAQSAYGKVPAGIAKRAKKFNKPVLVIAGGIGKDASAVYDVGIDGIMAIVNKAMPLDEAMSNAAELLEDAAERAMRIIKIGMKLN